MLSKCRTRKSQKYLSTIIIWKMFNEKVYITDLKLYLLLLLLFSLILFFLPHNQKVFFHSSTKAKIYVAEIKLDLKTFIFIDIWISNTLFIHLMHLLNWVKIWTEPAEQHCFHTISLWYKNYKRSQQQTWAVFTNFDFYRS